MLRRTLTLLLILGLPSLPAFSKDDKGIPAEASPTFHDPLTKDPMMAKSLSLMSPGMGHFYNGDLKKMRKYQRRMSLSHIPFIAGLCLDIGKDRMKGVDQWKDLTVKNFPW